MLPKDGTVLATGDRIYGQLNWACFTVISMGKISLAPLNILASVLRQVVRDKRSKTKCDCSSRTLFVIPSACLRRPITAF